MTMETIPCLDASGETHPYLRKYKHDKFRNVRTTIGFLYDVSVLQAFLVCLGRFKGTWSLAMAVRQLISKEETRARELLQSGAQPVGTDTAALLALEIYREEVASMGAHAARSEGLAQKTAELLAVWGPVPVGWRSRTKAKKLAEYYAAIGTNRDVMLKGLANIKGAEASERLFALSRGLILLLTDQLMLLYALPGVEQLQEANITESRIMDRVPIYKGAISDLLELKQHECEGQNRSSDRVEEEPSV